MANDAFRSPGFFSLDFHFRFLPEVIALRLRPARSGSGFVPSGSTALLVLVFLCVILLASGVAAIAESGPDAIAVALTLLGGGGLLAIAALSVYETRDVPTSYEQFDPSIFFFVIVLGATIGLWVADFADPDRLAGRQFRQSYALEKGLWTLGGLVLGYVAGIAAGLWAYRLGLLRVLLDVFAWPAIIGLLVADGVLLGMG